MLELFGNAAPFPCQLRGIEGVKELAFLTYCVSDNAVSGGGFMCRERQDVPAAVVDLGDDPIAVPHVVSYTVVCVSRCRLPVRTLPVKQ